MKREELKDFLDRCAETYNRPDFIESDPIAVPHRFSKLQDREIAGFLAATLAWGQRKTILSKSFELMRLMDDAPYDFICNSGPTDLRRLSTFSHRTFNGTDAMAFVAFLTDFYRNHQSLEDAFLPGFKSGSARLALTHFHDQFFRLPDMPVRTRKHVATPERGSACKRLNMFLRWMVRRDQNGVDFGCWKRISPAHLICPVDLHVERVARKLHLMRGRMRGWESAEKLTVKLRQFDPEDPVRYDFALFGLGVMEKW